MNQPEIICFGEMLWDILPTGKQAGGAPMNVAVHLKNLGLSPRMMSRIGNDELGKELLAFWEEKGLSADLIQTGETHLTGVVKANISNRNEVTYKILHPVAWDYIQPETAMIEAAEKADIFIFGSLCARSEATRETLNHLLKKTGFKVFDVNLRAPFFQQDLVEYFLKEADMVKMNEHELALIAEWNNENTDQRSSMLALAERFELNTICVTRGGDGAILLEKGHFYESEGYKVEVKDTIGSGDAFLAALLNARIQNKDPEESLSFACAMGSLVATYQGATPTVSIAEAESLQSRLAVNPVA